MTYWRFQPWPRLRFCLLGTLSHPSKTESCVRESREECYRFPVGVYGAAGACVWIRVWVWVGV